ncbi:MAG: spore coat associated protein CotJA [Candidatus Scatovivens sp.]
MNDNRNLFPMYIMYGHAYVPNQVMKKTFCPEDALRCGTIFPELLSPYVPGQSMKVIEVLKTSGGEGQWKTEKNY